MKIVLGLMRSFFKAVYSKKYLTVTDTVIGSSLMMVGDSIAQSIEIKFLEEQEKIDMTRVGRLGMIGGVTSFVQHFFYQWLDKRFIGKAGLTIAKKIATDEFVMGTTTVSFFFFVNGAMESKSVRGGADNVRNLFLPAFVADLCYWPVFQAINFYYLPTHLRITYLSTVTIVWNTFLCLLHIHQREKNKHTESIKLIPEVVDNSELRES